MRGKGWVKAEISGRHTQGAKMNRRAGKVPTDPPLGSAAGGLGGKCNVLRYTVAGEAEGLPGLAAPAT
jgi:hypothetical protein